MKNLNNLASILPLVMLWILCCGCGQPTTRVSIPIKVPSEIDVNRYSSFAVLPFFENPLDDKESVASMEMGEEIASMMRRGLGRHENLEVTGTQETARILTGETLDLELLDNIDKIVQFGRHFEVNAVIAGSYRFYTVSQPRRYYGERYSRSLQRYVTDYQDYLQKSYILAVQVMVIDVDTKELVLTEKFERNAVEAHTFGSFLVSRVTPHDSLLKNLAKQAVTEFTRKIAPHFESEERYLVK